MQQAQPHIIPQCVHLALHGSYERPHTLPAFAHNAEWEVNIQRTFFGELPIGNCQIPVTK